MVLGPVTGEVGEFIRALEIHAMDAGALLTSPDWRVCLSLYDGPLDDATVIQWSRQLSQGVHPPKYRWQALRRMMPQAVEFELPLPLSVGDFHPRAHATH